MRGYKIVARILLILSAINFTLTAPVVVREHEVRAIESNDGPGSSNLAPPMDGPSPSPLQGPAQSPSHLLSAGPSSPQDVYTSPVPTSQTPTDEPHPSPLAHGQGLADDSQESNPSSPLDSPTDRNDHLDVNSGPPSSLRFKYLSDLGSTDGPSHPPGSPQIPTDTHSSSMSSGSWASQAHVRPPPPNLPWSWSQPTRLAPNLPWRWSSRTRTRVPPPQSPEDQLATGEPDSQTLSTVDGPSRIPGPTDNHPQPAGPSNPGPSTEPNPPPSAEPLEHESWIGWINKIAKW